MNTGYLYFIENNALQCREISFESDPSTVTTVVIFPDGVARQISIIPSTFFHDTVWFKVRADNVAIGMFLHYNTLELDAAVKKFNLTVAVLNEGVK